MERCLAVLYGEQRLERFLSHITLKESFWQGYAEIETTALFKRHFGKAVIEPHLSTCKSVEFTFPFEGMNIFVEVAAPKMGQKFDDILWEHAGESDVVFVGLPDDRDRVKDAILQQFSHFKNSEVAALIVYNVNECEFDGKDVADRFLGTPHLIIYTNKATGQITTQAGHDADSVLLNDSDLVNLGGIICYKRDFDISGHAVYDIDLIGVRFPLPLLEKISRAFTDCKNQSF